VITGILPVNQSHATVLLLHLIENTFDRKRIFANPISKPNLKPNHNPKVTSFFEIVYKYHMLHNYPRRITNL